MKPLCTLLILVLTVLISLSASAASFDSYIEGCLFAEAEGGGITVAPQIPEQVEAIGTGTTRSVPDYPLQGNLALVAAAKGKAGPGESVEGRAKIKVEVIISTGDEPKTVTLKLWKYGWAQADPGKGGANAEISWAVSEGSTSLGGDRLFAPPNGEWSMYSPAVTVGQPVEFGAHTSKTYLLQVYAGGFAEEPMVPEPSSLLALGSGLMALAGLAIRRRR